MHYWCQGARTAFSDLGLSEGIPPRPVKQTRVFILREVFTGERKSWPVVPVAGSDLQTLSCL